MIDYRRVRIPRFSTQGTFSKAPLPQGFSAVAISRKTHPRLQISAWTNRPDEARGPSPNGTGWFVVCVFSNVGTRGLKGRNSCGFRLLRFSESEGISLENVRRMLKSPPIPIFLWPANINKPTKHQLVNY